MVGVLIGVIITGGIRVSMLAQGHGMAGCIQRCAEYDDVVWCAMVCYVRHVLVPYPLSSPCAGL